jgi:hypothetical protein
LESLQNNLRNYSWNHITLDDVRSVDEKYNDLVTCLHWHINACIPLKTVTLKDGRPTYVTPLIKSLLRKRNKLMRRSKITEANALTLKIGRLIAEH